MPHTRRDEVRLAYDDVDGGDPPLVFVHPWSGDRSFFAPQFAHFAGRHRCLAMDLRGHGDSDAPQSGYAMSDFADDVAGVMAHADLPPAVVVGHSMGGIVAVHVAARHADRVLGVVDLDSPILPPAGFADLVPPLLDGLRSPAFREVTRQFQSQFVGFADDSAQRDHVLDQLASGAQHVKVAALESVFVEDHESVLRRVSVPVLYVGSGGGFADLDRLAAACGSLVTEQVAGSGHFVQLEVPEQVNSAVERFVSRVK